MTKLGVTGATGGLGSRVLHHLLTTLSIPASDLIVSLHNPAGLPEYLQREDLDVRYGDFLKPETLPEAFAGMDKLLIVSYPSIAHDLRVAAHRSAINAARAAGIKHIYYTSLAFASDSSAAVMRAHQDTESYIQSVGIPYTIIREGIYNESYPLYLGYFNPATARERDRHVVVGGDGGIAWAARDDLGEGTARIMLSETDDFRNKTLLLSGAEAITLTRLAVLINEIMGWQSNPLRVEISTQEGFNRYHSNPQNSDVVKLWSSTFPAVARGELSVVDPLLQRLLPRKLKSMRDSLVEALSDVNSSQNTLQQYNK